MQIHIHKDGKTHGPYPVEQVRQYLKADSFYFLLSFIAFFELELLFRGFPV